MPTVFRKILFLLFLCIFSAPDVLPAAAQDLRDELSGVKFCDGALAFGYFVYNPASNTFGEYCIRTTSGSSKSSAGDWYKRTSNVPEPVSGLGKDWSFAGDSYADDTLPRHTFVLDISRPITQLGRYRLYPGTHVTRTGLQGSGEFLPAPRGLVPDGILIVTAAAPPTPAASAVSPPEAPKSRFPPFKLPNFHPPQLKLPNLSPPVMRLSRFKLPIIKLPA